MAIIFVPIFISTISIIASIFLGISDVKMKRESKTIKWSDLSAIADFVYENCDNNDFRPNIIFMPDVENYHLAQSISSKFDNILVLNGMLVKKEKMEAVPDLLRNEYYIPIDTDTWRMFVPKILFTKLFENEDNRILFVSEWAVTGGLIKHIKDYMRNEKKIEIERYFKSFCIAVTKRAIEYNSAPDFYWKEITSGDDLYLPWGKVGVLNQMV